MPTANTHGTNKISTDVGFNKDMILLISMEAILYVCHLLSTMQQIQLKMRRFITEELDGKSVTNFYKIN